jgi:hypothetical protein
MVGLVLARSLGSTRTLLRPRFRAPRFTTVRTTRLVPVRVPPGLGFGAGRFAFPSALPCGTPCGAPHALLAMPCGAPPALLAVAFGARPRLAGRWTVGALRGFLGRRPFGLGVRGGEPMVWSGRGDGHACREEQTAAENGGGGRTRTWTGGGETPVRVPSRQHVLPISREERHLPVHSRAPPRAWGRSRMPHPSPQTRRSSEGHSAGR